MPAGKKAHELQVYEALIYRKRFSSKDKRRYRSLKRGYEGEVYFDHLLEQLPGGYILLKDLCLNYNDRFFQIDQGLLYNNLFYMYEIKNYIGEYYDQDEKLYHISEKEVDDPLIQLKRSSSLLRQLFHQLGFTTPIVPTAVFPNPEFTLFHAPRTDKIILPSQLGQYIRQFNQTIPLSPSLQQLSDKLHSLNKKTSPQQTLPDYHYNELKKGMRCPSCSGILKDIAKNSCTCRACGEKENLQHVILRNIDEFQILFPNQKITTKIIHDWCEMDLNWSIRTVLKKNFEKMGANKGAYFVRK